MLLASQILFSLFAPACVAGAPSLSAAACQQLGQQDPVAVDRCLTHVKHFETPPSLIDACANLSASFDVRFRCLKSGADLEAFRLCTGTSWPIEAKIICLRASPSKQTMRACLRQGGREEELLECVRLGRE